MSKIRSFAPVSTAPLGLCNLPPIGYQYQKEQTMTQVITTSVKDLVAAANAEVTTLTVHQAQALVDSPDHVIVDLRDIRELQRTGKIPGAFSCPRGMLEFWIDPASPYHKEIFNQDKTYVFYCASAWRSALSAKVAQDMGLKPVAHIAGGFTAWLEAGGPVEALPPS
jgi:rhodanese-related sulfurtransferase